MNYGKQAAYENNTENVADWVFGWGGGNTLKYTDQVELNFLSWIQSKLKFRLKHITSENIFYK